MSVPGSVESPPTAPDQRGRLSSRPLVARSLLPHLHQNPNEIEGPVTCHQFGYSALKLRLSTRESACLVGSVHRFEGRGSLPSVCLQTDDVLSTIFLAPSGAMRRFAGHAGLCLYDCDECLSEATYSAESSERLYVHVPIRRTACVGCLRRMHPP